MSNETTIDSLWSSHQTGDYYPSQWRNKLSVETAYAAQLEILQRRVRAGASHVGWKVGLTADAVRAIYDATDPVFGYLLEEGGFRSGHSFNFDDLYPPLMETEILITLKKPIEAANANRETVGGKSRERTGAGPEHCTYRSWCRNGATYARKTRAGRPRHRGPITGSEGRA